MKKKIATILTAAVIGATAFTTIVSAASGDITVVSREDGSGTRGAFVELFGIEEEKDGEKVDMTTDEASVTNSTSVMMTTVAGDENAIGYISLGSLDDTVKAVKIMFPMILTRSHVHSTSLHLIKKAMQQRIS